MRILHLCKTALQLLIRLTRLTLQSHRLLLRRVSDGQGLISRLVDFL